MSAVSLPSTAPPARGVGADGGIRTPAAPGGGRHDAGPSVRRVFSGNAETYLAIGVVAAVALLVLPLPPPMLDALLALSFGLSIVVLLVTLSSRDPIEFNIFPSMLLLITLLRLGLNVSSTRLILSTGHAGRVIAAFGNFVIGGNYVVGMVIFLILVVINFMVITKGAGRIAEVAARFTLDAMPGRQMSIDADLGAGLIDETEARRRREEIARYADFFGSMDGAAKFVRGDAVAGLVITAINLLGGFIIGMTQHGMSASQALATYSTLTVGDGLVTQIPALIVSTSAGILVTYGTGGTAMAPAIMTQLTRNARALWTAAVILALFAVVPGLPALPFLLLAAAVAVIAYRAGRRNAARYAAAAAPAAAAETRAPSQGAPALRDLLSIEPLELEIGYALVPLADESAQGDLVQRVGLIRKQLAYELGMIIPPVRIRDNIQLTSGEYAVLMRGVRVAGAELMPRHLMALDSAGHARPIDGVRTTDPSFGIPAVWIAPEARHAAEAAGYTVVEPQAVLSTHLMEIIRLHAADLLSRQNVRELLESLKETHPALVEDIVPGKLSLGAVHRVLQRLLREGIPIRDLVTILEALSDAADQTKDAEALTEHVRRSLASVIASMLAEPGKPIRAITVGPRLEVALMQFFSPRSRDGQPQLEPEELTGLLHELNRMTLQDRRDGQLPPLITPPGLRIGIRRLVEPILPRLPVIALSELPPQAPILNLGTWELRRAN
ncbi:MAG: flagellar biosynthesis protein FlhA [Candidatus Eiseniibacteriota bacterium]